MKNALYIAAFVALTFAVVAMAGTVNIATDAEYHVQRNGVEQFCASHVNVSGGGPAPPDPLALTVANIKYGSNGTAFNQDVTEFANVFGRNAPNRPIQPYPYVSSTTPTIQVPPTRSLSMAIHMPGNPGTASHQLKSNSYGSTGGIGFAARVVPINGSWASDVWSGCAQTGHQFSENAAIFNFSIGPPVDAHGHPIPPNPSRCYIYPSESYKVLVKWILPASGGNMTFTWY